MLSHLQRAALLSSDESVVTVFTCLASFSEGNDQWTSSKALDQATILAETYVKSQDVANLLHGLLRERIKPLFARSKNAAITRQGRKAIHPLPNNEAAHSDLDVESKPWKYRNVYIVTVFHWLLSHLNVSIAPVISALPCSN